VQIHAQQAERQLGHRADAQREERSALRLLLDLKMDVVGEAADWSTAFAQAPVSRTDMLLVDWDLLPIALGVQALAKLRVAHMGTEREGKRLNC